jgi:K+-sensing histidine kinase KdpD
MMKHRRGVEEEATWIGRDDVREVRDLRTERTERIPRFARGTNHGTESVVTTLDEGVMIAKAVQDNMAVAIAELRATAERAAFYGPAITHRTERSLASLLAGQRLVGEMIDLACLEAGRLVLRREPTVLSVLLTETVEHCILPVHRRHVQIDTRHPTRCRIDRERIGRVIGSFLHAALTYGYLGSPVVIRVEEQDHRACVLMTDVGPGVTTTQAQAMFQKRQPSTGRGNAVGLYVSRKIIEAHGGSVGIDTIPSVGTTFCFRLPVMG